MSQKGKNSTLLFVKNYRFEKKYCLIRLCAVLIWRIYAKRPNRNGHFKCIKNTKLHLEVVVYGPLHVLWQVSFGCWVTWSISSWQVYYKSVFFFNFTKLQFLNDKIYSYTKKTIWHLAIWQNWCLGQFYHSKICKIEK